MIVDRIQGPFADVQFTGPNALALKKVSPRLAVMLNAISFEDWTKAAELSLSKGLIPDEPSEIRSTPIKVACAVRVSSENDVIITNIFSLFSGLDRNYWTSPRPSCHAVAA